MSSRALDAERGTERVKLSPAVAPPLSDLLVRRGRATVDYTIALKVDTSSPAQASTGLDVLLGSRDLFRKQPPLSFVSCTINEV